MHCIQKSFGIKCLTNIFSNWRNVKKATLEDFVTKKDESSNFVSKLQLAANRTSLAKPGRGNWPSGLYSFRSVTEIKLDRGCKMVVESG